MEVLSFCIEGLCSAGQLNFQLLEVTPNDNFVEQLEWNAKAQLIKLSGIAIAPVAVAGHSYGAFMTANFAGNIQIYLKPVLPEVAHNRTLTPLDFKTKNESHWQAPRFIIGWARLVMQIKLKTLLLLIHGEADNNPGTFPIQSERLYNAIKGMAELWGMYNFLWIAWICCKKKIFCTC